MRVEGTEIPAGVVTTEKIMRNNPCCVGDEVILKKKRGYNPEYESVFGERNNVKTKCIGVHRFFINFSDGLKTFCVNKADIHTGLIKIELAR